MHLPIVNRKLVDCYEKLGAKRTSSSGPSHRGLQRVNLAMSLCRQLRADVKIFEHE